MLKEVTKKTIQAVKLNDNLPLLANVNLSKGRTWKFARQANAVEKIGVENKKNKDSLIRSLGTLSEDGNSCTIDQSNQELVQLYIKELTALGEAEETFKVIEVNQEDLKELFDKKLPYSFYDAISILYKDDILKNVEVKDIEFSNENLQVVKSMLSSGINKLIVDEKTANKLVLLSQKVNEYFEDYVAEINTINKNYGTLIEGTEDDPTYKIDNDKLEEYKKTIDDLTKKTSVKSLPVLSVGDFLETENQIPLISVFKAFEFLL